MASQFQSLRTFIRDFFINLFVSILVAILFGIKNIWWGIISFFALISISMGYLIFKRYERFLKVLWSGAHGYYYSFPVEENKKVWEKVNHSFRYLGISSDSILPRFMDWVAGLPQNSRHMFYFLLMDPEAKTLAKQISHQKDLDIEDQEVKDEVQVIKKRITTSIEMLKNLEIYKEKKLQIRIYDEFVPWWIYIFDEEKIFIGILPRGKSGLDSPVLILKNDKKYTTLFNAFFSTWERMWNNAKDA